MTHHRGQTRPTFFAALVVAAAASLFTACGNILEVDNPNNVGAEALDNPSAAASIVVGAENSTARAVSSALTPYTAATDEAIWVGSRDAYGQLDNGGIGDPNNEYPDAAFFNVGEARWLAEQAIAKLEGFKKDGKLLDEALLVRAYLNGAIMYNTIADIWDDTPISDRQTAGPNVGEQNMSVMYDSATTWLDRAAAIDPNGGVLAMRARTKFSKAIWQKLNPPGTTPADPLVNDAGAAQDAAAAIPNLAGDFFYSIATTNQNVGDGSGGGFGFEFNNRGELAVSPDLASLDPDDFHLVAVTAKTGTDDETAKKMIAIVAQAEDGNNPPMVLTSKREMYLILAEVALAGGDDAGFDTNINAIRALDGMPAYSGAGPTRLALLQYERRINLIFQGRRLSDMYRFGVTDGGIGLDGQPRWLANSTARKQVGCLFPIPITERRANPDITGDPVCKP
jgi:starch-binding outer membrane protein, SusD/RagB family